MTDHHAVDGVLARAKPAEDLEFVGLEIGKRPRESGELMVGVTRGRGVAREVLSTGEDSRGVESGIKDPCLFDDLVGGCSITATTKGVVGLLVEGDVEDGAEIEIETENPKELSGQFAMAGDEFRIALVAELAGIRRLVAEEFQSGDAASFLVDRDDRFNVAEFPEAVGKCTELGGGLDVSSKEDESSRLDPPDEVLVGRVDLAAGNAEEQKLTG
jgi:hypothetical protein